MKIINGNEFCKIADFSIDVDLSGGQPYKELTYDIFKQDAIIYCKIDYIGKLFDFIKLSDKKYVLITHDSDYPVDAFRFAAKPSCIVKWFGKNVTYDHPDLINIPIGVENEIRHQATPKVDYPWFNQNLNRFRSKKKNENVVYCNWNIETNPHRRDITNILSKNGLKIEYEKERLTHKEYCEKASSFKYIICPEGNGVSTHRVWESLYMKSIPIVLNHRIYRDYTLPILKVKSWHEVTNELLKSFNPINNEEMLDFIYWKNLIYKEHERQKSN